MDEWDEYDAYSDMLNEYIENYTMPDDEDWEKVYQCSKSSDYTLRYMAAEVMLVRCNEQDENRLLEMTYDRQEDLVTVCAVESLQSGIQEKTLRRLYELMRKGGCMVRGYAAKSFFKVWVSRYGYTEHSVKKCWRKMEKLYKKEKDPWVRTAYATCRYLCGDKKGLSELKQLLWEGDLDYFPMAASSLVDVRTIYNEKEVNEILRGSLPHIDDKWPVKEEIKEYSEGKERPRILILDRKNEALSQMMEYISDKTEERIFVKSAGLSPAEKIREEVIKEADADEGMRKYYYPKYNRAIWYYDFIAPLGIKLRPEQYPFHKIIPLFEEVDENIVDMELAKKMVKELYEYVYSQIRVKEGNGSGEAQR